MWGGYHRSKVKLWEEVVGESTRRRGMCWPIAGWLQTGEGDRPRSSSHPTANAQISRAGQEQKTCHRIMS